MPKICQKINWLANRVYILKVPKYKLVTFQNSGTHWMRGILANYFHSERMKNNSDVRKLVPIYRDASNAARTIQLEDGICIETTHETPNFYYFNSKVILLKRDLLHAMSSHYQHAKSYHSDLDVNKDEFLFGDFYQKRYGFANVDSRLAWIKSWYSERITDAKLAIWYEDLKKEPMLVMKNICHFMDWRYDMSLATYALQQSDRRNMQIDDKLFSAKIRKDASQNFTEVFSQNDIDRVREKVEEYSIPSEVVFYES